MSILPSNNRLKTLIYKGFSRFTTFGKHKPILQAVKTLYRCLKTAKGNFKNVFTANCFYKNNLLKNLRIYKADNSCQATLQKTFLFNYSIYRLLKGDITYEISSKASIQIIFKSSFFVIIHANGFSSFFSIN